jgi:conjugal transfer pilus assembly protein TraL
MEAIRFPKYIDSQQRLLFWTADQLVPFSVFVVIGMMLKALFVSIVAGVLVSYAFTRYRDSRPDGFLIHMAYWYGVLVPKGRSILSPFLRRILPA